MIVSPGARASGFLSAALFFLCILPMTNRAQSDEEPALGFPTDFSRADFEARLRPEHPRLLATGADWERLAESLPESPELQATVEALKLAAADLLERPPEERVVTGRRLLDVSREVLRRVLTLASLYRITGDDRYAGRARDEMLRAAAFSDWNPSHFLDTAEMTLAVALGYDWLHDFLAEEERAVLREAIVEKGLRPGTGRHTWKNRDNNWNQVCFAGMVAGALAVGEHEPELAVAFLRETFDRIHLPLDAGRPHGAYPEGPSYWSYGTHFQVILINVLESALGTAWHLDNYPAFQESSVYINLMAGPSGEFFNYADGHARLQPLPALHWFAARAANPALDARERERILARDPALFSESGFRNRFFPLTLLWLDPRTADLPPRELPLHWRADGPNPLTVHRSSWEEDGLFFAIKGGSPSVNHGHMDIGSFVLDWNGVRWAADLGMENYHRLESRGMGIWNRAQDSDRWRVFRMNTHSHNTLVFDGQNQLVNGFAPILDFSSDPANPFTVVDMTAVYANAVERAVRRAAPLPGGGGVLIEDDLAGFGPEQSVRWAMMTRAEIELRGNRAVLRSQGAELHARIIEPDTTEFEVVSADPPPHDFDSPNRGARLLVFKTGGSEDGRRSLRVLLSIKPGAGHD